MDGELSVSQKRIWYARDQLMDSLSALGLPAGVLDGSHAMIRDVASITRWLVPLGDQRMAGILGKGPSYAKALTIFSSMATINSSDVIPVAPTGFSIRGGNAHIDGAALKVRLGVGQSGDKFAYVVPLSRKAMSDGSEWIEQVAMVPMDCIDVWMGLTKAADTASRTLDAGRCVMRVYNGSDVPISPIALDDLVLDPEVKSAFADDIVGFLGRRNWYTERALPWKRSYLLNGPPGTGKTSLARWAASSLGMPCMSFDFTDRMADGRDLSACMARASAMSPCVLVFDDLDKVLDGQNRSAITPHALQTALSGMGGMDGIILVATCNDLGVIRGVNSRGQENPFARRFDAIIDVPLPDAQLRMEYGAKLLTKDGLDGSAFGEYAVEGWSFDDVRAAVTSAANSAVSRKAEKINISDLKRGIASVQQRRSGSVSASARAAPEDH